MDTAAAGAAEPRLAGLHRSAPPALTAQKCFVLLCCLALTLFQVCDEELHRRHCILPMKLLFHVVRYIMLAPALQAAAPTSRFLCRRRICSYADLAATG